MAYVLKRFFNPYSRNSLNAKLRKQRFKQFQSVLAKLPHNGPIRILDIGGTISFWERMGYVNVPDVHITLVNIFAEKLKYQNFTSLKGDACDLREFKDKEFDLVFSNSVIEHLFNYENQKKMADEVQRVGNYYYIQTPNLYFPIEPHWLFPFFQFLPFQIKLFLTHKMTIGRHAKDLKKAASLVNEVRLLTLKEMKQLFKGGRAYKEKFFGLTKSITMYNAV